MKLAFFELEPVDFAAAAWTALEACGFCIRRLETGTLRADGLDMPVIALGAASLPSAMQPLWRSLIASGKPVLALAKEEDFAGADWLDQVTDVIFWPPARGELAFRVGRWSGKPSPEILCGLQQLLEEAGIVGRSPALLIALADLPHIASAQAPVLITGETGTGKDLVARALHYGSTRRCGPFVPVNCGALPESLFENELFGHAKGAYTHAHGAQIGLIARADQGTLFLDEIDALSLRSQIALLRFVQDGQYCPLGTGNSRQADVRIIAATNRPLEQAITQGRFRDDLFYRLNILSIALPPLRARGDDVRLIADAILARLASKNHKAPKRLSEVALQAILHGTWPGNIRELEAALHRAVLTTSSSVINCWPPRQDPALRPEENTGERPQGTFHVAKRVAVDAFERHYLVRLIGTTSGNVSAASRIAGTERRTLGRLLSKHGIDPSVYRDGGAGPAA